ncbi:MAG TPA: AzlC family ABC transporter permease [Xanthobacteraceae bacterium]|nr:AzlC family ABC transporter permease [Xanthobacteraceae bacterium]
MSKRNSSKRHAPHKAEAFLNGAKAALTSVQGMVLFASYIGYGGLCAGIGFPFAAAVFTTTLILALPSQLLLVTGFAVGSAPLGIALAVFLSAARLLPSVVTLLPYLRTRLSTQLFASHFVAVSIWVESRRLLPPLPAAERVPFYFGLAITFNAASVFATWLGYVAAGNLPHALAMGLSFLTPMSFIIALTRNARDLVDHLSLIFGLILAPVFVWLHAPLDILWVGLFGGGLAWFVHRQRRAA